MTSAPELASQLRALGLEPGAVVVVHTSFRAIMPIEGGPNGVIDALIEAVAPAGTVVMPTMTDGTSIFDRRSTPTLDMGIVAETFWRRAGVVRSGHPGGSFAAHGPAAAAICAEQPLEPPHGCDSPIGRVLDLDGWVLLLGVDHDANTTLHLAETMFGVPYSIEHPCVIETGETVMIAESDHCCLNFNKVGGWLEADGLQRTGPVGNGGAKLARSADVVRIATRELSADPLVFLCDSEADCAECDLARRSIGD